MYDLVDSIQQKKGKFDILLCIGNFMPVPDNKTAHLQQQALNVAQKLEEFYDEILSVSMKNSKRYDFTIDTYFIDSTEVIGPFMNSKQNWHKFHDKLHFLGRSGIKTFP